MLVRAGQLTALTSMCAARAFACERVGTSERERSSYPCALAIILHFSSTPRLHAPAGNSSTVTKAFHKGRDEFMALKIINIYERDKRHQLLKELYALVRAFC